MQASADVVRLLEEFVVVVVPMANPDGYVYSWEVNRMWRKTRSNRTTCDHGREAGAVDPNRNWNYKWGQTTDSFYRLQLRDPCTQVYAGAQPFSEPEVASVASYLRARQEREVSQAQLGSAYVAAFVDFHSYAQMILSPWAYSEAVPTQHDLAYQNGLMDALVSQMKRASGRSFQAGNNLFDSDPGTAPDWAYGVLGVRASFTVELEGTYWSATGFCLPHNQIRSVGNEQWQGLLALSTFLSTQGAEPSDHIGLRAEALARAGSTGTATTTRTLPWQTSTTATGSFLYSTTKASVGNATSTCSFSHPYLVMIGLLLAAPRML